MSDLLDSGDLQRHIFHTLQPAYARRYRAIMSAVEKYLIPLDVALPQRDREVVGGYFVWLSLPAPLTAHEVAMLAKRDENLIVAPGPLFAVYGDEQAVDLSRNLRISFSWEEETKLTEGIQRLGQVVRKLQRGTSERNP